MTESNIMDTDTERDLSEIVRLAILFALVAVDCYILWDAVKDRPDILVARQRVRESLLGPWRRWQELRRAERHAVWEAIEIVGEEKEEA